MMPHPERVCRKESNFGIQLNKVKNGVNMVHGLNYSNLLENGLVIIRIREYKYSKCVNKNPFIYRMLLLLLLLLLIIMF